MWQKFCFPIRFFNAPDRIVSFYKAARSSDWHADSDAAIGSTLWFRPSHSAVFTPLSFTFFFCLYPATPPRHSSLRGLFSLEWFVYPQSPWVISAVIIAGVGNKHTHSASSARRQTHARACALVHCAYMYVDNGKGIKKNKKRLPRRC